MCEINCILLMCRSFSNWKHFNLHTGLQQHISALRANKPIYTVYNVNVNYGQIGWSVG